MERGLHSSPQPTQVCVEFKKDLDDMHAQDDHAEGISSAVDIQSLVRSLGLG